MLNRVKKLIALLRKLQKVSPRSPLITIYKLFILPHIDYEDIIYDQTCNISFHQELESIQYNVAPAITRAIIGSSREKIYHKLGFESFERRWWNHIFCCFYKVSKLSHLSIYLTLFLKPKESISQEMMLSYLTRSKI